MLRFKIKYKKFLHYSDEYRVHLQLQQIHWDKKQTKNVTSDTTEQ